MGHHPQPHTFGLYSPSPSPSEFVIERIVDEYGTGKNRMYLVKWKVGVKYVYMGHACVQLREPERANW